MNVSVNIYEEYDAEDASEVLPTCPHCQENISPEYLKVVKDDEVLATPTNHPRKSIMAARLSQFVDKQRKSFGNFAARKTGRFSAYEQEMNSVISGFESHPIR